MNEFLLLLAGALLCNCIPHLAAGVRGEPFPSPFAKPFGVGHSPPIVNFYWGSFNLVAGLLILWSRLVVAEFNWGLVALVIGFLAMGTRLSLHFGKVWQQHLKAKADRQQ